MENLFDLLVSVSKNEDRISVELHAMKDGEKVDLGEIIKGKNVDLSMKAMQYAVGVLSNYGLTQMLAEGRISQKYYNQLMSNPSAD